MNQLYQVTQNHLVKGKNYEIKATVRGKKIRLQGAWHVPGSCSWHMCSEIELPGLPTQSIGSLVGFIESLPESVWMPMNSLIVHICTVYQFLHGDVQVANQEI